MKASSRLPAILLPVVLLVQMCGVLVFADGFPLNSVTQEVYEPTLRLRLTDSQQKEVASKGVLTLDEDQRKFLLAIYPNLPARLQVLSATFNDSVERADGVYVDCFWVAPAEVALTLPPKPGVGPWMFQSARFADEALPGTLYMRLGPDGKIYESGGREIDLAAALKLIENAPTSSGDSGGERVARVTLPPPYRTAALPVDPTSADEEGDEVVNNRKVRDIFAKLKRHSEAQKVVLDPVW